MRKLGLYQAVFKMADDFEPEDDRTSLSHALDVNHTESLTCKGLGDTAYCALLESNVAVTVRAAVICTVQELSALLQDPPQPTKKLPCTGVAFKTT